MSNNKKKYGQYFTPREIAEFMINLTSVNKKGKILEPGCGEGVFLKTLIDKGFKNLTAYEIDKKIISKTDKNISRYITSKSFVTENFNNKFDLIIGNPPYIRWKNLKNDLKEELKNNTLWAKYFNSLCDYLYIFILKSIEILNDNGELIFITPEYWINTKHSKILRNYMVKNGYFEKIYHFCETPIFNGVASSIVIFKYRKGKIEKNPKKIKVAKFNSSKKVTKKILNKLIKGECHNKIEYLEIDQFSENQRWVLANDKILDKIKYYEIKCKFSENQYSLFDSGEGYKYNTLGDIANIGNGMVSGLDIAFRIANYDLLNKREKKNTIRVLKAKNISPFNHNSISNYIFIKKINKVASEKELINNFPNFYKQLYLHKKRLNNRYNYNKELRYWEWAFLRNYNLFSNKEDRIFVPSKERISNKNHFRFTFVKSGVYPTQDVTAIFPKSEVRESIYYILALLNSPSVFNWLKHKGVIKGNIVEFSEKPLNSIPIRLINWNKPSEIKLHDEISSLCKKYIKHTNNVTLTQINLKLNTLLSV